MSRDGGYHNNNCSNMLPNTILLTLFYGLPRMVFESWRGRRGKVGA